ncbi:NADPH2:quinone reductase [Algoriphagus ratkowskyi]|uniref:NADPH2:quinone reductase n=1 Tax=Algoriphagus ratkowskyi TaxID=57028 RepID=A0A2W7RFH2_9BACT|nr:NADPH:quinone oxidoreductase family protein [Algoriphagus ratkowskyi]PZX59643.1 NADPH2:quinone reductase [Algoriphagus ratkowskyi]TXD78635.1 NADPH:quinone oxidoreductase family protein [Algoriphagus ratkowskyi]
MKAIICEAFGSPENLILGTLPDPKPGKSQVVIAVEVCGVSYPDLLILENKYQFKPELPYSPGGEVVGEIVELGENVDTLNVGDRVLALCRWGGLAEKVAVDSDRVFVLPHGISSEVAASSLYTYSTSFHALKDRAELKPGETVLVLGGAGGIGLAAIELAKIMGANVIAAASSDEKLALCKSKGADETINYESEDLKNRIKELTNGKGVDVIVDPVGGKYTEAALRGIAWKGRYLVVGFANGEIPKIPMNLPLLKGCAILGVFWGNFSEVEPEQNKSNMNQLYQWLIEGRITGHSAAVYELGEAKHALLSLEDRGNLTKGIVRVL